MINKENIAVLKNILNVMTAIMVEYSGVCLKKAEEPEMFRNGPKKNDTKEIFKVRDRLLVRFTVTHKG